MARMHTRLYAIGDIIPTLGLAHASFAEGFLVADKVAGKVLETLSRLRLNERITGSDGLPIIGRSASRAGVVYATGHYRNGILLAPITAPPDARQAA